MGADDADDTAVTTMVAEEENVKNAQETKQSINDDDSVSSKQQQDLRLLHVLLAAIIYIAVIQVSHYFVDYFMTQIIFTDSSFGKQPIDDHYYSEATLFFDRHSEASLEYAHQYRRLVVRNAIASFDHARPWNKNVTVTFRYPHGPYPSWMYVPTSSASIADLFGFNKFSGIRVTVYGEEARFIPQFLLFQSVLPAVCLVLTMLVTGPHIVYAVQHTAPKFYTPSEAFWGMSIVLIGIIAASLIIVMSWNGSVL